MPPAPTINIFDSLTLCIVSSPKTAVIELFITELGAAMAEKIWQSVLDGLEAK